MDRLTIYFKKLQKTKKDVFIHKITIAQPDQSESLVLELISDKYSLKF